MSYNIMVQIPADQFYEKYENMVKLLEEIERMGSAGISTRSLCEKVFHTRHANCLKELKVAERNGYITRDVVPGEGRGHPYTLNKISKKGKKLLEELKALR
jgi:hypothetical protein